MDDAEINLLITSKLLETFNIKCDTALSGKEAIEKIGCNNYNLVLMDHMMPEMDGVETTKILREQGYTSEILPIVALTGNAADNFTNSQFNDYISKPIDREIFSNMLKKWLPEKIQGESIDNKQSNIATYSKKIAEIAKNISEIDIDSAIKRMGGNSDIFESSLKILTHRMPETMDKINSYLAAEDIKNFTIEVHGIKGSLMNVGVIEIAKLAEALEERSKNQDIDFCKQNLPELNVQLLTLYEKLSKIIDNEEDNISSFKKEGDIATLRVQIEEINQYIENFEIDEAIDTLKNVMSYTYNKDVGSFLQKLLRFLEEFEYEKAAELIAAEKI